MIGLHRLILLIVATTIFALGLVMIFSTTSAEVLDHDLNQSTYQALIKQMCYAISGIALGWGVWSVGYQRILAYSGPLLVLFTFLLLLTLLPGVGREVNGSKRWLNIAGFSLQPSEFVKYIIPAFFIHRFCQFEKEQFFFRDFIKLVGIVAIPMFLILIEPNNGTTAVIAITLAVLFFLIKVPFKYWALPLLIFLTLAGAFAYHLPYVGARVRVYLHPELDLKGKGHQPHQAKIAAGSGKVFGKGPGNSLQKLSYLPEAQNDYIAAIFAEEFGFIGMISLIFLYMLFVYQGFYIAHHSDNLEGFYYAGCVTFLIGFQAFLNLGVVSGLVPSTGLNLPFFSQGGSSLLANIVGLSILLSVSSLRKAKTEFFA